MTFRRLAAIALVCLGTTVAWGTLGASVARPGAFDSNREHEVVEGLTREDANAGRR